MYTMTYTQCIMKYIVFKYRILWIFYKYTYRTHAGEMPMNISDLSRRIQYCILCIQAISERIFWHILQGKQLGLQKPQRSIFPGENCSSREEHDRSKRKLTNSIDPGLASWDLIQLDRRLASTKYRSRPSSPIIRFVSFFYLLWKQSRRDLPRGAVSSGHEDWVMKVEQTICWLMH